MKKTRYDANKELLRTLKNYKKAVSEHNLTTAFMYQQFFEAQWNILYHLGIKKDPYPFIWMVSYNKRNLYI